MRRATLAAAVLAQALPFQAVDDAVPIDAGRNGPWRPKQAPTYSATPNLGFGQRVDKARTKAKAARQAKKQQRMRAKGKR